MPCSQASAFHSLQKSRGLLGGEIEPEAPHPRTPKAEQKREKEQSRRLPLKKR